ncbi:MAG: amidase family protein [Pseudomonadota bacterium]|nr:amidase family protein [Pseudomonadota bacterium]
MMQDGRELWQYDATELAHLIKTREVSSVEVVDAHLSRIDDVNPRLNAIVMVLHDLAKSAAVEADKALARGEEVGKLHGVPVTTKVNTDQAGCPSDNGVEAFKDLIADDDSATVSNLKKSGALIIGRTNTPEFSMRWFTENKLHGNTLNPWNPDLTPGGSSGGAASLVASGMAPIGQGNDIAGSVRYPAYCCGLVGLRPSIGRVPAYNPLIGGSGRPISAQLMAVQGPLTRTVRDARIAIEVFSMRDHRDPNWVDVPRQGTVSPGITKIALVDDPAKRGVAKNVGDAVRKAGKWLEDAGFTVEKIEPPRLGETADLWASIAANDVLKVMQPQVDEYGNDDIKTSIEYWRSECSGNGPQAVLDALAERESLLREWVGFMEEFPVILMPVSCEEPFPVGFDVKDLDSFKRTFSAQLPQLAIPVLGLPAVAVPTGINNDVPMGVQIVSGRYCDHICLDIAEIIEARTEPWVPVNKSA